MKLLSYFFDMNALQTAWDEFIKELFRLVSLSLIPVVISMINEKTGAFNIDWRVVAAVAAIALLRALDRFIHIYNRQSKPGLTGESLGIIRTNW